ncbi:MAG: hypothetical protein WD045_15770 [Pirellulaceae bacterium]
MLLSHVTHTDYPTLVLMFVTGMAVGGTLVFVASRLLGTPRK